MPFKSHALRINDVWIGGVLSTQALNDATVQSEPTAGSVYPLQVTINQIKNRFSFRTYNVDAALGQIGAVGLALSSTIKAELYEINWTDAGQIASGSVHRRLEFAAGRVVPRRLTCRNTEDAELEIESMGLSDNGANSPLVITESVALPAAVDLARHTMSAVQIAGIAGGCIESLELDFGIEIESRNCTSQIFDTRLQVNSIVPKVTVQTLKADIVGTGGSQIPTTGKACTHANTHLRFRKRLPKVAGFVADATAEHVSITIDGTVVPTTIFEGERNQDGLTTLEITGMFDGTNLPLVINPATALA